MSDLIIKIRTILRLGLLNLARVLVYRLSIRFRINSACSLKAKPPLGLFFVNKEAPIKKFFPAVRGPKKAVLLFGYKQYSLEGPPPDWLSNPFTGQRALDKSRPWWRIPDFDSTVGDIKLIWEQSRMDWALSFAQQAAKNDEQALKKLNEWLADWCIQNPPFMGPNWKCGQEASIRVMHLAIAAHILSWAYKPTTSLLDLIEIHLKRIAPTISYAIAQDNNHGTSEGAALYIGGSWLMRDGRPVGKHWAQIGERLLENRAKRLIGHQGSFSQYSLNYHRLMLDAFCIAEVWRRKLDLPAFSLHLNEKLLAATKWLQFMVNPFNGAGPNLGANDGAHLMRLANTGYRDYRPTVQLAMVLFAKKRAYVERGSWNDPLMWLQIPLPKKIAEPKQSYLADDGGFAILRRGQIMVMLRYPRFHFRPSQADVLHLDLWVGELNMLRDAGTFSYNTDAYWLNYFGGTSGHNTVQFDGRNQMPRISRFLLGDWIKPKTVESIQDDGFCSRFGAGYVDKHGISHYRKMTLTNQKLLVIDEINGFKKNAVLRWRLAPGKWDLMIVDGIVKISSLNYPGFKLLISASRSFFRCELVQGWESLYYQRKTPLEVLEFEVIENCRILTEVTWLQ